MVSWGDWAPVFDPLRAIGIDEIEALYQPRTRAPHLEIARRLRRARPEDRGIKAVIVGSRGSGKSTELARLASVIRDAYLPIRLDLSGAFDPASTAIDLVVLLAAALERTAAEWGRPPSPQREALRTAVVKLGLDANDYGALVAGLEPAGAGAGAPGLASAAGGVMSVVGAVIRQTMRALQRDGPATDQARLLSSVNLAAVDLRVEGLNDEPVLFLVEGLDKLTDLTTIASAFRDVDLVSGIVPPIVLTAPVAVRHQPWVTSGALRKFDLWNAAVVNKEGSRNPEGILELSAMFERRLGAAGGPPNLVSRAALEEAAFYSSGNAREFFRILEAAMDRSDELGRSHVDIGEVDDAIGKRRHELQVALRSDRLEVLDELLGNPGPLRAGSDADELLYENFIACYPNQDAWFRPHEILVPYLRRRQAGE